MVQLTGFRLIIFMALCAAIALGLSGCKTLKKRTPSHLASTGSVHGDVH
jgi:hypothetical protein